MGNRGCESTQLRTYLSLPVSRSPNPICWATVSPPCCFAPCFQSGSPQSPEVRGINAYLGSGSETFPNQLQSGGIESPIISLTIIPSQLSPHLCIRADRCRGTGMLTHFDFPDRGGEGGMWTKRRQAHTHTHTHTTCMLIHRAGNVV